MAPRRNPVFNGIADFRIVEYVRKTKTRALIYGNKMFYAASLIDRQQREKWTCRTPGCNGFIRCRQGEWSRVGEYKENIKFYEHSGFCPHITIDPVVENLFLTQPDQSNSSASLCDEKSDEKSSHGQDVVNNTSTNANFLDNSGGSSKILSGNSDNNGKAEVKDATMEISVAETLLEQINQSVPSVDISNPTQVNADESSNGPVTPKADVDENSTQISTHSPAKVSSSNTTIIPENADESAFEAPPRSPAKISTSITTINSKGVDDSAFEALPHSPANIANSTYTISPKDADKNATQILAVMSSSYLENLCTRITDARQLYKLAVEFIDHRRHHVELLTSLWSLVCSTPTFAAPENIFTQSEELSRRIEQLYFDSFESSSKKKLQKVSMQTYQDKTFKRNKTLNISVDVEDVQKQLDELKTKLDNRSEADGRFMQIMKFIMNSKFSILSERISGAKTDFNLIPVIASVEDNKNRDLLEEPNYKKAIDDYCDGLIKARSLYLALQIKRQILDAKIDWLKRSYNPAFVKTLNDYSTELAELFVDYPEPVDFKTNINTANFNHTDDMTVGTEISQLKHDLEVLKQFQDAHFGTESIGIF